MGDWPVRLMYYGAGEAVDGAGALSPQMRRQLDDLARICTNSALAATAQLDSSWVPTQRFVLDPAGRQPVEQLPNVNVGDPRELLAFARWSAAICPAQRSVLVLSGHGAAWEDGQFDDVLGLRETRGPTANLPPVPGAIRHSRKVFGADVSAFGAATRALLVDGADRDYLSNAELGAVCGQISTLLGKPIDVVVFDACLMSSIEVLAELGDSVRCVVASIDELSAEGIDLAAGVQVVSRQSGRLDAPAIAAAIAQSFMPKAAFDSCVAVDVTAPAWQAGLDAVTAFCDSALEWVGRADANAAAMRSVLSTAAGSMVKFTGGGLADIGSLAGAAAASGRIPPHLVTALDAARHALGSAVLARRTGQDYREALGLSLFTPESFGTYAANRPQYLRLRFPTSTRWGSVLDRLYGFDHDVRAITVPSGPAAGEGAVEFVVSLRGLPIDAATRKRIGDVVRRTALEGLAQLDALTDVSVTPIERVTSDGTDHVGVVVRRHRGPTGEAPVETGTTAATVGSTSLEVHVLVLGIALDDDDRRLLDASIRSAVLGELAMVDHLAGRPVGAAGAGVPTRSILDADGGAGAEWLPEILGMTVTPA